MRRVTIAVIGNGKTSRANVEALLGDIFDSVDQATVSFLADSGAEGSTWAKQFSEDRGAEVKTYSSLKGVYDSVPDATDLRFFLLWDDEDPACQNAAAFAQEHNIPMFDLTDGLVRITTKTERIDPVKPVVMPEVEKQVSPDPQPVKMTKRVVEEPEEELEEEVEEEVEEYEDEVLDYSSLGDILTEAFEEVAKVMAAAFVTEVRRLLEGSNDAE